MSIEEIAANNYNLDIKNANTLSEQHEDPDELLARFRQAEKNELDFQNELKVSLDESTEG